MVGIVSKTHAVLAGLKVDLDFSFTVSIFFFSYGVAEELTAW